MTKSTNRNARKAITTTRVFPIVLKQIVRDAFDEKTIDANVINENMTFDKFMKRVRTKMRADANCMTTTSHVMNTSHVAHDQSQYDAIRMSFDVVYRTQINDAIEHAKIERANARRAKRVAKTNVDDDAKIDA